MATPQPRPPSATDKVAKRMTLRTLAKRALREEREKEKREKIKEELDAMRKVREREREREIMTSECLCSS
jgi:hypothetical protein